MSAVQMEIASISKLDEIWSPEVFINGIPWRVIVRKDENWLVAYLKCAKEDDTSNWTVPAGAKIELLTFSDDTDAVTEYIDPNVFSLLNNLYGAGIIQWDKLLNDENKYVKNDTIRLNIEITTEDPNYLERSILKFENIDDSQNCWSNATFRLTLSNVGNLMAVRSPRFLICGLPWELTVYKCRKPYLCISLSNKSFRKASCTMTMSIKLLSTKNDVDPIEDSREDKLGNREILEIEDVIPWDDLLKPENGFVNNGSITLEVKVKAENPEGDIPNIGQSNVAKRHRFECSVCFEVLDNQDISTTQCGHLFCTGCIKKRDVCPMCQKAVKTLQRIYLPA